MGLDTGPKFTENSAHNPGLTDHAWSLHELLTFPYHRGSQPKIETIQNLID